jgi:hypothetical protein
MNQSVLKQLEMLKKNIIIAILTIQIYFINFML